MVRKHRRRTRKRNKKGGSIADKWNEGIQGLKDIGAAAADKAVVGAQGVREAADHVQRGYQDRTQPGGMFAPIPAPPSSHPPMDPVKEKQFSLESPVSMDQNKKYSLPLSVQTNQPTKEKQGGLLGLGTWFGLGGRRLSHSSFINKMLRVRNKTKRNKAIRKYLKGGKKKSRKRKTKRRGGMNPQGGDNNLPRRQPQQRQRTEEERLAEVRRQVHAMQSRRMEEARRRERAALLAEANKPDHLFGGKRKRKNKTKKRRRRR